MESIRRKPKRYFTTKMAKFTPAFRYSIGVKKGRGCHVITATIWPAKRAREGDWESRVTLQGLTSVETDFLCAGTDGLQAHILGLVYIRGVYRRLAKAGFVFLDPDSRTKIDPEWAFAAFKSK